MDRIVVTTEEVSKVKAELAPITLDAKPPKNPAPIWARIMVAVLVLALPLLALMTAVLRLALRNQPAKTRYTWTSYLCTLLIVSAVLTSVATTIILFRGPVGLPTSSGLSELDERERFPELPAQAAMSAAELGTELKPLVIVASPMRKSWFAPEPVASGITGAGMLLEANKDGYLFATAGHVVDGSETRNLGPHQPVMISTATSGWARATVIGRSRTLDAALIWMPRHGDSKAGFCQAIAGQYDVGTNVFVIGHPEGLNFTLSTGLVSRIPSDDLIQISAPVSPGNSGGPVYDARGELLGIVVGSIDARMAPNAQNLNFAVRADALRNPRDWEFYGNGRALFADFNQQCGAAAKPVQKGE